MSAYHIAFFAAAFAILATFASQAGAGPLHDAVKAGDIVKVTALIASGEDVNQDDGRWDAAPRGRASRQCISTTGVHGDCLCE